MPELPEVETVRLGLQQLIVGKTVKSVDFDWPKSFPNSEGDVNQFLVNSKVLMVRRRAKVLIIDLSSGYSLVIHLKMTGQLVFVGKKVEGRGDTRQKTSFRGRGESSEFISEQSGGASPSLRFGAGHPSDSLISKLPDKSTRVEVVFIDDSKLFFNDQRKFGWMRLIPTIEIPNIDFMKKVGPEPLEPDFTNELFISQLQKRKNSNIKAALLDQTVLAGIGNIYADESLWGAKIHPAELVKNVSKSKLKKLHEEIIFVLKLSIEKGGSTDRNYVNAEGKKGSYIDFARVFRREGLGCPRHPGVLIIKTRVAGRGTHTCPKCQPLTK